MHRLQRGPLRPSGVGSELLGAANSRSIMKFYRELMPWLEERGRMDVAEKMVFDALGELRTNGRSPEGQVIWLSQLLIYFRSGMWDEPGTRFGCEGNLKPFYDVWVFLNCPGLVDSSVVARMREASLLDEFRES